MFYQSAATPLTSAFMPRPAKLLAALAPALFFLCGSVVITQAQGLERVVTTPEQIEVTIKNLNGRVVVTASDEQPKNILLKAESPGAPVRERDVVTSVSGSAVEIDVRVRLTARGSGFNSDQDRIDLSVRIPPRSKVRVITEAGAVDIIGNVAAAAVETDTGTIRADVPLDALRFSFVWTASRPRYFSEVELPQVKERRGGRYEIAGNFGDKKAKREGRIELELTTERGLVLFGVTDPSMVPSDLRARALTESARAIIRSGDEDLIDAIRKVAPRLVGDYTQTLPPPKGDAPSLRVVERRGPGIVATNIEARLARLNASVTDRNGRAIGGLIEKDFAVFENGEPRAVTDVTPTDAPFNLVLLLDVSGSVEERLDFIRKAALAFLNTVSAQDRVAIISFRDDVQLVSDFTTDRRLLVERIKEIEAGGGTALYDSLAYTLVNTLKPLRGERTAVVVLSDGDDNKSFLPFPSILEAALESGALIYPLYIPSGLVPARSVPAPVSTLDPMRTRFLTLTSRAEEEGQKLASISGGVYYPLTRLDDLQRAYDDVVVQLRTAYTITFASNANDTRERRIRVRVARDGASVRLSPAVGVTAR